MVSIGFFDPREPISFKDPMRYQQPEAETDVFYSPRRFIEHLKQLALTYNPLAIRDHLPRHLRGKAATWYPIWHAGLSDLHKAGFEICRLETITDIISNEFHHIDDKWREYDYAVKKYEVQPRPIQQKPASQPTHYEPAPMRPPINPPLQTYKKRHFDCSQPHPAAYFAEQEYGYSYDEPPPAIKHPVYMNPYLRKPTPTVANTPSPTRLKLRALADKIAKSTSKPPSTSTPLASSPKPAEPAANPPIATLPSSPPATSIVEKPPPSFACRRCPEQYTSNTQLHEHIRLRHAKKPAAKQPILPATPSVTPSANLQLVRPPMSRPAIALTQTPTANLPLTPPATPQLTKPPLSCPATPSTPKPATQQPTLPATPPATPPAGFAAAPPKLQSRAPPLPMTPVLLAAIKHILATIPPHRKRPPAKNTTKGDRDMNQDKLGGVGPVPPACVKPQYHDYTACTTISTLRPGYSTASISTCCVKPILRLYRDKPTDQPFQRPLKVFLPPLSLRSYLAPSTCNFNSFCDPSGSI